MTEAEEYKNIINTEGSLFFSAKQTNSHVQLIVSTVNVRHFGMIEYNYVDRHSPYNG